MKNKSKIILDVSPRRIEEVFATKDLQYLYQIADVVWGKNDPMPDDEVEKVRKDVVAIITGSWRYGDLTAMPKLQAILEMRGGHPNPKVLDYKTCFARNIRVLSVSPAFGPMVAEMALGMALAASRKIVDGSNDFQEGKERYQHPGNEGAFSLYGQTVGLVGCGSLAKNLMPLLLPFGCEFLGYDPWLSSRYLSRQGIHSVDIDSLLEKSKVIFVLAKPSAENEAFLNRDRLALINRNAVLVLISRSHVVDFDALTEFLYEGRFKAAIDVFPKEPLPPDHPIRHAPGVVLSAHRAGTLREDMWELGRIAVNDLDAILQGLPPREMLAADPAIVFRHR